MTRDGRTTRLTKQEMQQYRLSDRGQKKKEAEGGEEGWGERKLLTMREKLNGEWMDMDEQR